MPPMEKWRQCIILRFPPPSAFWSLSLVAQTAGHLAKRALRLRRGCAELANDVLNKR